MKPLTSALRFMSEPSTLNRICESCGERAADVTVPDPDAMLQWRFLCTHCAHPARVVPERLSPWRYACGMVWACAPWVVVTLGAVAVVGAVWAGAWLLSSGK